MAARHDLEEWVYDAVRHMELKRRRRRFAGTFGLGMHTNFASPATCFYSWQYDMRRAAKTLRDKGRLAAAHLSPRGKWVLRQMQAEAVAMTVDVDLEA